MLTTFTVSCEQAVYELDYYLVIVYYDFYTIIQDSIETNLWYYIVARIPQSPKNYHPTPLVIGVLEYKHEWANPFTQLRYLVKYIFLFKN